MKKNPPNLAGGRQSDQGDKPRRLMKGGGKENKGLVERTNQQANQTGKKGSHGGNR